MSMHIHHKPKFPTQFLPDPRISLVNNLPKPNHCCLTQVTHGEQKQKVHSRLSPSSSEASFPWPEWLTSTPVVTLMTPLSQLKLQGLVYDILPLEEGAGKRWSECGYNYHSAFRSLAQHSSVAKHSWPKLFLTRNVSSKFRKGRKISWT